VIDSSAWIEFLNGNSSRTAEEVSKLLGSEHVLSTCGLIVAEVFQGLRRESGFARDRDLKAILGSGLLKAPLLSEI